MRATVAEIIKIMDQLAPPLLAEEWDNVGLQIGDPRMPVRRIWVALDASPAVVKAACQKEVDLLITHHPLIFKPLKSIEVLAQRLGLRNLSVLQPVKVAERAKEDIKPLTGGETEFGIGRIGSLAKDGNFKSLVSLVKKKLKLDFVKVTGDPEMEITQVAICSGSGSSLMQAFLSSKAQAYISGDIHYHDAREAQDANRGIIDIGHFPSEHLMVETLAQQLEKITSKAGIETEIMACAIEKDPFKII